jgi:hypothetical protein
MATDLEENETDTRAAVEHAGFERVAALISLLVGWMRGRASRIEFSYLLPERDGYWGWYVIGKADAFDFALNRELADFVSIILVKGYSIHGVLLPGSVDRSIPNDSIAINPLGQVGQVIPHGH